MCAQRRFRSACAFAQSDQNLFLSHFRLPRMHSFFMQTTKTDQTVHSPLGAHVRRYVFSISAQLISISKNSHRFAHNNLITEKRQHSLNKCIFFFFQKKKKKKKKKKEIRVERKQYTKKNVSRYQKQYSQDTK